MDNNFGLPCIYFFKSISLLPGRSIKSSILLSGVISRIYLATQATFSWILESLLHSSQLQRLLFTISRYKYTRKKILIQHSVNAHPGGYFRNFGVGMCH